MRACAWRHWRPCVCRLGQVAYLFAEQAFTDKQLEDCINHLDTSQMSRLRGRPENKVELDKFLPSAVQRLLQYACYLATRHLSAGTLPSPDGVAGLQSLLLDFISMFLPPEMRVAAETSDAGAEAEPRESADATMENGEEPEAESAGEDNNNDFDAFDLSQPSPAGEETSDALVEDNPRVEASPHMGRATHDIGKENPELTQKLVKVYALCNFQQESSLEKLKEAINFVQSGDPLFERCGTSPQWTALVTAASQWVSEHQAVLTFGQNLKCRIDQLTTQVDHAKSISTLCAVAVKSGSSATNLSTHIHEWWHHYWQKGELVTQAVEFLDEIELVKDKARICNKGLGLASKVRDAKEKIHDIFNFAFNISSSLWWLTVRMIQPDTPPAEAEPRLVCPADAFDQYARMWEETGEVLSALEKFGIRMPRAWSTTLRAADLRRAWLAFGSHFLRALTDPTPPEASRLANMKALAAAAVVPPTSLPNTIGADVAKQADHWAELAQRKELLIKRVARDLSRPPCCWRCSQHMFSAEA